MLLHLCKLWTLTVVMENKDTFSKYCFNRWSSKTCSYIDMMEVTDWGIQGVRKDSTLTCTLQIQCHTNICNFQGNFKFNKTNFYSDIHLMSSISKAFWSYFWFSLTLTESAINSKYCKKKKRKEKKKKSLLHSDMSTMTKLSEKEKAL